MTNIDAGTDNEADYNDDAMLLSLLKNLKCCAQLNGDYDV